MTNYDNGQHWSGRVQEFLSVTRHSRGMQVSSNRKVSHRRTNPAVSSPAKPLVQDKVSIGGSPSKMELVESAPVDSDFDQADIRNVQEVWMEMIEGAKDEILWETFYIAHKKGEATEPVLNALKDAAKRGVDVKLLVDEKFLGYNPEPAASLSEVENIEIKTSPMGKWFGGVMHAKGMFVDGEVGFLGSQNLDWRSIDHVRELGIRFEDKELVSEYTEVFNWEWNQSDKDSPPAQKAASDSAPTVLQGSQVYPTFSPTSLNNKKTANDQDEILNLLNTAEESVEVALLSYNPVARDKTTFHPEVDNALRAAATRGVDVRLMVGNWMEHKAAVKHLISLDALDNLEVRACRVPEGDHGDIPFARVHHSKYLLKDNEDAWMGTSNWEHGYFHKSRNIGMIIQDGEIPQRIGNFFEYDWERSTAIEDLSDQPRERVKDSSDPI